MATKVPSQLIASGAITSDKLHTALGNTGVTANSSGLHIGQDVGTSATVQFQTITGSHAGTIAAATTGTTQANTDNSAKMATTEFVTNKIQELIGGAPSTLNDLNELAAAINDDASYNSTLTTALALKAPIASPTFTGAGRMNGDWTVGAATGEDKLIISPQAAGSGTFLISYNDAGNAYEPLTADFETLALRTSGTPRLSIDSSGTIALAGNLTTTGTIDGVDIAARDAILTSTTSALSTKLPLAGGTLTGALTVNGSNGNWTINSGGNEMSFSRDGANYIDAPASSGNIVFRTGTSYATALTIASNQMAHFEGNLYAASSIYVGDDVRLSSDGSGELGIGYGQTPTSNRFSVYNNTTTALQVKPNSDVHIPNGNLYLGTSSNAQSSRLRVSGKIVAGDASSTSGDVLLEGLYNNGATVVIGSERSSGGVFLGYGVQPSTTTQGQLLSSTPVALTQAAYVIADQHKWYTTETGSAVAVGSQVTGATEAMRLTSTGRFGIGTDNPGFRFHAYHPTTNVVGRFESGDAQVWIDLHDSNSGNYGALLGHHGAAGDLFKVANASVDTKFVVKNDAQVGIGTGSPAAQLHVYNNAGGDATDKASMLSEAVMKLQPHTTNSTNMLFAQVDGGSSMGIQVTNGPATADWDLSLSPFGGRVGIGTVSPEAALEVNRNGAPFAAIIGAPQGSGRVIQFKDNHASPTKYNWVVGSQFNVNDAFEITPSTAVGGNSHSSPALLIDPSGDIGFGVAPYTNAKVTIGGTQAQGYSSVLQFDNNDAGGAEFFMLASDNNWSVGPSRFVMGHGSPSSSNADMVINSDGEVGIGVWSPTMPLVVASTTNYEPPSLGSSDGHFAIVKRDSAATGNYGTTFGVTSAGHGWLQQMRIDGTGTAYSYNIQPSGGSVMIGSGAVPQRKLHVYSGTPNVTARFESTDAIAAIEFKDTGGTAEIGNSGNDVVLFPAGTERFRVQNDGFLVAQSASQVRLVLGSEGNSQNNSSNWVRGNQGYLQYNAAVTAHTWEVTGSEKMRLLANNNVGIAVTDPKYIMDVGVPANSYASFSQQLNVGQFAGIHFGYRENNINYRKSAIVFQRTDKTSSDAQGRVHILNGPQDSTSSAGLGNAAFTIAENGACIASATGGRFVGKIQDMYHIGADKWGSLHEQLMGNGSTHTYVDGGSGNYAGFRFDNESFIPAVFIPYSPNQVYRLSASIYQESVYSGQVQSRHYMGVIGYDENFNFVGVDGIGTYQYNMASSAMVSAGDFLERDVTIKGWQGSGATDGNKMDQGTVYIRPMMLLNYQKGGSKCIVTGFSIMPAGTVSDNDSNAGTNY